MQVRGTTVAGVLMQRLPPRVVRAVGRAQFRFAPLRWLIARTTRLTTARRGRIAHGVGAGLVFDGTGGQPGFLLGTTEPEEQQMLADALEPGATFYDIGANVGFFSTIAARLVGPEGRVYAFEPYEPSARQARLNAELNGFGNVTVVEAAVADRAGTMTLRLSDGPAGHRLAEGDGVPVAVVAIDEWRSEADAPGPSVVMLDVEGAEIEVLRGMAGTIRDHRPTILCEVHWLGDAFDDFVAAELEPLGYRMRALEDERPPGHSRWHAVLTPA